jgi:PrgI family protein
MQFPVPQFTEVEDKIIGSLTLKQFGIIFGAGVVLFLGYSATKSILVLVFLFLLFGVPAIGLAFAQINGRPVYNSIGNFVKFILSPKLLIFHKEVNQFSTAKMSDAQLSSPAVKTETVVSQDPQAHLKEVQELLRKTASQETDIAGRLK